MHITYYRPDDSTVNCVAAYFIDTLFYIIYVYIFFVIPTTLENCVAIRLRCKLR